MCSGSSVVRKPHQQALKLPLVEKVGADPPSERISNSGTRETRRRSFEPFPNRVRILQDGPLLDLKMENGVCPHFDRQCTAYEGRPIECELFPHTMHRVIPMGMFVFVTYHHRVVCPIRSELFATDAAAREKITALIRNVYGPACRPVLINENADRFRVLRRAYFWLQCLAYPSTRFRVPLDHAG